MSEVLCVREAGCIDDDLSPRQPHSGICAMFESCGAQLVRAAEAENPGSSPDFLTEVFAEPQDAPAAQSQPQVGGEQ